MDDAASNVMEQIEYMICLPLIVISFVIYLAVIGQIFYVSVDAS